MQHRTHKIAAIIVLLAVFMVPFYLIHATARSEHGHAYLDTAGLRHMRSNVRGGGHVQADPMESISSSVGIHMAAQ